MTATKATFYHAGCPVCVQAEQQLVTTLDQDRFDIEIIHLGENQARIPEAEAVGVKSVPAIVIDEFPYHINFGASIEDVKS